MYHCCAQIGSSFLILSSKKFNCPKFVTTTKFIKHHGLPSKKTGNCVPGVASGLRPRPKWRPARTKSCQPMSGREELMRYQMPSISRRSFMGQMAAGTGTVALSPMVAASSAYAAEQVTLTLCSYGGVYQESQDKAYFKPY